MANNFVTFGLTDGSININTISYYATSLFHQHYSKLFDINQTLSKDYAQIYNAITDIYTKLGIPISKNWNTEQSLTSTNLRELDIIKLDNPKKLYVILSIDDTGIKTFPSVSIDNKSQLDQVILNNIGTLNIYRPPITQETIKDISPTLNNVIINHLDESQKKLVTSQSYTFSDKDIGAFPDGIVQIGDIKLLVGPTDLSFVTQNGYSYFPTLRTSGSPKIPSMQQVKNISLSVIFVNQDAINYQLISLMAMYRRTPFVNVRNNDICEFFKELKLKGSNFIPVALESIHLQSIEGFPNSVKANINLLPFEPLAIGGSFKALRSMRDVAIQQDYANRNRDVIRITEEVENKLQGKTSGSIKDQIAPLLESTYNFKESLPFRAYYQSLIKDRENVTNELGEEEFATDITGSTPTTHKVSLSEFRPIKRKQYHQSEPTYYRHYDAKHNNIPIHLTYKHIDVDPNRLPRELSQSRLTESSERSDNLQQMVQALNTPKDLLNLSIATFYNIDKFWEGIEFSFLQKRNAIDRLLAENGIPTTLNGETNIIHGKIKGVFSLLWHGMLMSPAASIQGGYNSLTSIINEGKAINPTDVLGLLKGVSYQVTQQDPKLEGEGYLILDDAFVEIINWANSSTSNKEKFAGFIQSLTNLIQRRLSPELLEVDSLNTNDESLFRLPISSKTIQINNSDDVITGWSLLFNNKFVPIYLQGFKYPYYQHLGSDDMSISLMIRAQKLKNHDLKSELSLMSDRIYNSTKVILLSAPELIKWIDPRIKLEIKPGHILSCLGISHVIYNSANVTNKPGSPNVWDIHMNLSQAQFTLEDYHKLVMTTDVSGIEDKITSMLLRSQIVDNKITVYKYYSKDSEDGVSEEIKDIDRLFKLNFLLNDTVINELYPKILKTLGLKDVVGQKAGSELAVELSKTIDGFKRVVDTDATELLNKILQSKSNIDIELKRVLNIYDQLIQDEISFFGNSVQRNIGYWERFFKIVPRSISGDATLQVLLALSMVFAFATTLPVSLAAGAAIGIVSIVGLITNASIAGIDEGLEYAKNELVNRLSGLADKYRRNALNSLVQVIIKDPVFLKSVFKPEVTDGIDLQQELLKKLDESSLNCYPDFDSKKLYTLNIDNEQYQIKISPDFYLYNDLTSDGELNSYLDDSINRIATTSKMGAQYAYMTRVDIINKFRSLEKEITAGFPNTEILNKLREPDFLDIPVSDQIDAKLSELQKLYSETINPQATQSTIDQTMALWDETYKVTDFENEIKYSEARAKYQKDVQESGGLDHDAVFETFIGVERDKNLFALILLYSSLNSVVLQKVDGQDTTTTRIKAATENLDETLKSQIQKSLNTINSLVGEIVNNPSTTSGSYKTTSLSKHIRDGIATLEEGSNDYAGIPQIQILMNNIVTYLSDFIRFNEIYSLIKNGDIQQAKLALPNNTPMYQYWNIREYESKDKSVELLSQLHKFYQTNPSNKTIKMFPTFKLYFIEEDRGLTHALDEFFSYDAVQSIEVVKRKDSASNVAVIRLSNVTNTLTDQLAVNAETSDYAGLQDFRNINMQELNDKNVFLGTLNVKPGTEIMIKLGYAASDRDLPTVFMGRIIEMNVGPVVELICQSHGAQLNHEVIKHKFGFLSLENSHGDIASALLDMIPGLEMLGSQSPIDGSFKIYSGKDTFRYQKNVFNKFLMSNLLGKVSADVFAQDNPRDDNIYLPFDYVKRVLEKPTFDWVVYNQSIWSALNELCLYHKNHITTIRPFNNDPFSTKNDLRETIVIGDKSGYYKYTDAFTLSSLPRSDVKKSIDVWKQDIKSKIINNSDSLFQIVKINLSSEVLYRNMNVINILPENIPIYDYFQNEINGLLINQHLLSTLKIEGQSAVDLGIEYLKSKVPSFFRTPQGIVVDSILKLLQYNKIDSNFLLNYNFNDGTDRKKTFETMIENLKKILKSDLSALDLNEEYFYTIKPRVRNNTDEELSKNIQYTKIQKHHLVTDTSDIISNNISLNTNFKNAVNLYYLPEPKFISDIGGITEDLFKKINVWPIKAFGDIKDEHVRALDTFQKNVDTNWWDVRNFQNTVFKDYLKLRDNTQDGKVLSDYLEKTFNKNFPSWEAMPHFIIAGINLLRKEVSKMYGGTLELMGTSEINPYDIVHIEDYMNDMHGPVEVEEVTLSFTPDRGYRTIITPNLITYDRNPITTNDLGVISKTFEYSHMKRIMSYIGTGAISLAASGGLSLALVGAATTAAAPILVPLLVGGTILSSAYALYNGTIGFEKRYTKFIYDLMGRTFGRDCINFTTLYYHGSPYIAGFDGVDYTSLKTMISHQVQGIQNPIARWASSWDPEFTWIVTNGNPDQYGFGGRTRDSWDWNIYRAVVSPMPNSKNLKLGLF